VTSTGTRTTLFTITDARQVGAKIGADLRLLNGYYSKPTLAKIDDYVEEVALLLKDGYLNNVSYGFRDALTNEWKFRLRYTATKGGELVNSPVGRLPATAIVSGLSFYTYLIHSPSYIALSPERKAEVDATLPFVRSGAEEPATKTGSTSDGHGYSRNGVGVSRDIYEAE
jgi:hypothetical protein